MHEIFYFVFCFYCEKDREREFMEDRESLWREGGGDVVPSVTRISVKCYLGPAFVIFRTSFFICFIVVF